MAVVPWTILVEKEETLAASSRLHSTFVSKFIKTEMKKGGLAKLRGKTSVRSQTNEEEREKRDSSNSSTVQKRPSSLQFSVKIHQQVKTPTSLFHLFEEKNILGLFKQLDLKNLVKTNIFAV